VGSPSEKVLITGIDSFTGRYLESKLTGESYDVHGIVIGQSGNKNHYTCDLQDRKSLECIMEQVRPDTIIHLACVSFVVHGDPIDFYAVNLFGTLNLLDALLVSGCAPVKTIIASSANVYGNAVVEMIDETEHPDPVNHYALSKYAMEQMAKNFMGKLNIVITRPFNYTGIGQGTNFLIPKIVDHFIAKKDVIELGNIEVSRDFSDVRDIVEAYSILVKTDVTSGIYNICSGIAVSLGDILKFAEEISGHHIDVKVNPEFVRSSDIRILRGSNLKLREIGYSPRFTVKDTLAWMLAQHA